MADPFLGEIKMFGGNFAPSGWAKCDGTLLSISSFSALFSILGTTYGGDGSSTFGLPDLRGRVPMHAGSGPGLTPRTLGTKAGSQTDAVTLAVNNLPEHTHSATGLAKCQSNVGDGNSPVGKVWSKDAGNQSGTYRTGPANADMAAGTVEVTVENTGGGAAVNVDTVPPFQCVNFIIALLGIFPSEN